jgi:hypothetical protein
MFVLASVLANRSQQKAETNKPLGEDNHIGSIMDNTRGLRES